MKKPISFYHRGAVRAFSLIELLVVVMIIGIIMGFVVPAVNGFGRSSALTTGGNLVVNMVNLARQNAVTKNTMTALVLLKDQGTDQDFRAFAVLEYDPVAGWSQTGQWATLPVGVVVDRNDTANCTFLANSPQTFPFLSRFPGQKNPPVTYQGQPVTAYATRIFMANGGLQNPQDPAQLRLVQGFNQGSQVIYTSRAGPGTAANYYDITILGMTGTTKVDRPTALTTP
ncbi:MAG: prepilin-type N-terminal cleavage/methylation domain-containing protein [Chthoniobacter sp.]